MKMKKILSGLILAAAVLVMTVSCDNKAKAPKNYTVTFDLNGGSGKIDKTVSVKKGDTVEEPAITPKAANDTYSKFAGWSTTKDGGEYDFSTPVNSDITLYATYKDRYTVGGRGPANGFIIYENPSYDAKSSNSWRYLEAASEDFTAVVDGADTALFKWGSTGTELDTDTSLGSGLSNTEKMTSLASSIASEVYKKTWCGLSDWFIPSRDELVKMYEVIGKNTDAKFTKAYYWSSSSRQGGSAWNLYFSDSNTTMEHSDTRDSQGRIRLVRVF